MQEYGKIVARTMRSSIMVELVFTVPNICAMAQPGQFVHIACGEGNLLRRPISICDVNGDQMTIVFQIKGSGTIWLADRKVGDTLDVIGPQGNGITYDGMGQNPVFIGGGVGVPPMLYAMKKAKAMGKNPTAILGFRNKDLVMLEAEFSQYGNVMICTDDGSYVQKAFVSDVLKGHIDQFSDVYACGPHGMLRALAGIAEENALPCFVSMEERMGCGIGACLVCACALKAAGMEVKQGHVCKDGPVFNSKEVVW